MIVLKDNFKFYWEEPFQKDDPQIKIEVPGFGKDNIKVKLKNNMITIKASKNMKKTENSGGYFRHESFSTSFIKSLTLPHEINPKEYKITVKDGIVTLTRKKK